MQMSIHTYAVMYGTHACDASSSCWASLPFGGVPYNLHLADYFVFWEQYLKTYNMAVKAENAEESQERADRAARQKVDRIY